MKNNNVTKNMEEEIVKRIGKKYNKKEKCIRIMVDKCLGCGYNINEVEYLVEEFFKK